MVLINLLSPSCYCLATWYNLLTYFVATVIMFYYYLVSLIKWTILNWTVVKMDGLSLIIY